MTHPSRWYLYPLLIVALVQLAATAVTAHRLLKGGSFSAQAKHEAPQLWFNMLCSQWNR